MANINIPGISTGNVVRRLATYYINMIDNNIPCKEVRPAMLFGPTGVGKSAAVYQIASLLEAEKKIRVKVVDIRLTDLSGIPSPNADKTSTIWLRPEIFENEEAEDLYYIFFFDEIDKASPAVQAAALQLILDRRAWTHSFPANTFVIAAANPARGTAKYETRMAPALMNRFRHFNVQPEFSSFREWGIKESVHPYVLGYLSYDQSKLYASSETEDVAFPTPRSWKSVSDTLKVNEGCYKDITDLHYDIVCDIGPGVALEFETWCKVYTMLPDTVGIIGGIEKKLPKTPDVMHALIASLTSYISEHKNEISEKELQNVFRYIQKLPADFRTLFIMGIKDIEELKLKLMKLPDYRYLS